MSFLLELCSCIHVWALSNVRIQCETPTYKPSVIEIIVLVQRHDLFFNTHLHSPTTALCALRV